MFGNKALIQQHERALAELKANHEARVSDLHSQIKDLRKLVFSPTSANSVPLVHLEADSILNQREETIEVSQKELDLAMETQSEADRLLAGNY